MDDIVVRLGNMSPRLDENAWRSLFPERSPRWGFAQVLDLSPRTIPEPGDPGPDALVMTAQAIGPSVGAAAVGTSALWIVLTNPVAGREAEYNEWYDGRHVRDTLAIPGFLSARRYRVTATEGPEDAGWAYLALYRMDLERAAEALAEAAARAGGPKMPNPGMLAPGTVALAFRPI